MPPSPPRLSTGDMERGERGAPAVCTLLLLGIGLQLISVEPEVIASFGPIHLLVNGSSTPTKDTSQPEEPATTSPPFVNISGKITSNPPNSVQAVDSPVTAGLEVPDRTFPVSPSTTIPDPVETVPTFHPNSMQVAEPTSTIEPEEPATLFPVSAVLEVLDSTGTVFAQPLSSVQAEEPTVRSKPAIMATTLTASFSEVPVPSETSTALLIFFTSGVEPTTTVGKEDSTMSTAALPSEIVESLGTVTASLLDSIEAVEPTSTTGPISSEVNLGNEKLTVTSFSAQPSVSLAVSTAVYDWEMTNEALYTNVFITPYLEASAGRQEDSSSLDIQASFFTPTAFQQSPTVTELAFFDTTEMPRNTESLTSTLYAEVETSSSPVRPSIMDISFMSLQTSAFSVFPITAEDTFVVYSTPVASLLETPVTLHSSTHGLGVTGSEDITSIATKNPSMFFSNVGLATTLTKKSSPDFSLVGTPFPFTSMEYEISSSFMLDLSRSLDEEGLFPTLSSPVPTLTSLDAPTALTSNIFPSESKRTEWLSEDVLQTMSIAPSVYPGLSVQNAVTSDTEFLEQSTSEVLGTLLPWSPLASMSVGHVDMSSVSLSNLVDSFVNGASLATSFPSPSFEMGTNSFFVVDSTMFMPSPTDFFFTATASVVVEPTLGMSTVLPMSTPYLDMSLHETMEAPAFVPTESVLYFSHTAFPSEESVNTSDLASSYESMDLTTLGPSSSWSSFYEDVFSAVYSLASTALSEPLSQGSQTMWATTEFFQSSSVFESQFIPPTETINFEGSGLMPWQTLSSISVVSVAPFSSTDGQVESSSVFPESSELLGATSVAQWEPSILYTSYFAGATSQMLPSFPSSESTAAMPALFTTSIGYPHTSSALTEENLQTSLSSSTMHGLSSTVSPSTEFYTFPTSTNTFYASTSITPSTIRVPLTQSLTFTFPLSRSVGPTTQLQHSSTTTISYSSSTEPGPVVVTSFIPTLPNRSTAKPHNPVTTDSTTVSTVTSTVSRMPTNTPTSPMSVSPPSVITAMTSLTTTRPTRLCDVSNPEPYLVTAVLLRGTNIENLTESIKDLLTLQFNRSVELEVYSPSPRLSFIVTSGPFVYTSIAVGNMLSTSRLLLAPAPPILSLQTATLGLDQRFHIQTVLQFVPQSVDIRLCTFSEQIQRGLSLALYEVRRWRQENADNFTVQIVNITTSVPRGLIWKAPVTVSYAVKEQSGFLNGSDVSDQLRNLSIVEFSFFLGFPVKQIAEPSRYPQLNVSPLLKDSWLKTVLLGVLEHNLRDEAFQAEMERKLAQLISEASVQKRRWKRASFAGGNTVQVVNVSRLDGSGDPVQLIYFIEDHYGGRLSATKASDLINEVNIQRAAIIMGYRLQGVVAQPVNQVAEADRQAQNLWIIVGVAVPVLVVTLIIVILYWKLCRTDKLDFQPDTMSNLQQRQKLQAPNVKGFDFAKQHLGQHNKDEILVVHEPPSPILHGPLKDSTPSENGDVPTPKSKSSTKPLKLGRHRGRITPSDAGSTGSEPSSGKESAEEGSPMPSAPPRETTTRPPNKGEMPLLSTGTEHHSSASIFEHVDRISRSSEASRRFPSKIQLIAMQPITAPPLHGLSMAEREAEANKINKEIQTTLRHKSEIEHHRNKIRLRAKRKGHYEFPLVDVVAMTDTKERQRMYRRAQMQFDKILDPVSGVPTVFIEPRRSSRSRRSPKQRRRQQGSCSPPDADRDRLITTDSDGTYRRPPGVSNSAYVSDPDLPSDNPTPVSDLGKFPGSPHRPPPPAQYVAPQPSIEEVRQTMQSLLDDAFALVAPSSQPSATPGVTQTSGTSGQQPTSSTPARSGRSSAPWGSPYPPHQASHFNRYVDYNMAQPSAPSLLTRSPGFGSGFLPPAEMTHTDSQQADTQYPARGMYPEDIPPVARPRPLGSTSGSAQIHQLTQVGIASRMGAQPPDSQQNRAGQAPATGPGWSSYYHLEEGAPRNVSNRELTHPHGAQDYGSSQMFPVNRVPVRQALPTSHHAPSICYPSGSAEDLHPGHSSSSLIKAIREELLRLSQKQAAVTTYHS
ncbi:LOW QUALITY PROTEIN: UPF0606 protein KIAA1549 homolog [Pelodytes ibericus]